MPVRKSNAIWEGNLPEGKGTMKFGGGAFEGAYSFKSRFEEGRGTNPEELIGAAHAGCYSMALSNDLAQNGFTPDSVSTEANVHLNKTDEGFAITEIELVTEAKIPNIDEEKFLEFAEGAKNNCPVSKALAGTSIKLNAKLVK
jgi:osmotically inducible protein OsmC